MFILGLTGSIGMGKTVAAELFRRLGVPVHDADKAVHKLTAKGGKAVTLIGKAFPGTIKNGAVERAVLAKLVFANPEKLSRLEAILHPMVRRIEEEFLWASLLRRRRLVVLDIPLLFETGGEIRCDAVAVVTAPLFIQARRVLRRPGMEPQRFAQIRAKQIPDVEKRRRADFIIPTGLGRAFSFTVINDIVHCINNGG